MVTGGAKFPRYLALMQVRLMTVLLMVIPGHIRDVSPVPVIGRGIVMLYGGARCLTLILLGLPTLIMPEIVKDACRVTVGMQDSQHRDSLRVWDFLRVPRIGHRLVLIVLELNMSQLHVRNILHVYPTYAKLTLPLVLRPDTTVALIINRRDHLSHAAKVTRAVYREEQI